MPVYKKSEPTLVYLPSTLQEANVADRAWIKVKTKLTLGDILDVNKVSDPQEQTIVGVLLYIVDWNYTDEAGTVLELTADSVKEIIEPADFLFIGELLKETIENSQLGLAPEEKKTSSDASAKVITVDQI